MTGARPARVLSIPAGVPFLPTLANALVDGGLVPGYAPRADPFALADATIYVPTRRAARALRSAFVECLGGVTAILPTIRPLGEFEEDAGLFDLDSANALALNPPIEPLERILMLAPLVREWKRRLPAHVAQLFGEDVAVPASLADAIWLARDLAALMDEVETGGSDWGLLGGLVPDDLANWWQVTLRFLEIVTAAWPQALAERGLSNPAAHRNAMIRAEAQRLKRNPPTGPVIAAGSTGSIPATAELLATIANLPLGAVVLPGLDDEIDERGWLEIGKPDLPPASHGHPQAGLKKLLATLGVDRREVEHIAVPSVAISTRLRLLSEALRPAETTDAWVNARSAPDFDDHATLALAGVSLVEAANEREEALAIAAMLRLAAGEGKRVALVTGDRDLARRVASELRRFGIEADDSGGSPLPASPPATLLRLVLETVFRPGDPVALLALLKHPLLRAGMERSSVRAAADAVDLVALRGGTGRLDVATLGAHFEERLSKHAADPRRPFWWPRLEPKCLDDARALLDVLGRAGTSLRAACAGGVPIATAARASVVCLEALGLDETGGLAELYAGDAGQSLAAFLRGLAGLRAELSVEPEEWPDVFMALIAGSTVKPTMAGDSRVAIWGALEARLQSVDVMVLGGLNEGSWPRKAEPDRFMSRFMKVGMALDPPERRIGQAAHDFAMAMGASEVVLTRAARAGDAPALESRWLQRLKVFAGEANVQAMAGRGDRYLGWARALDQAEREPFAQRPVPAPPLRLRPRRLSVTEVETLRRDPYAFYARRVLGLQALEPLVRDPGAAERGTLFHEIAHAFTASGVDTTSPSAEAELLRIGRERFDALGLPLDIDAIWWPRFRAMASGFVAWERTRPAGIERRVAEARAEPLEVGASGVTLSGYADRVDLRVAGMADILDFKTGSTPSKGQAHTLLAPQLALEAALLMRGAFGEAGKRTPAELAYVRMRPDGDVVEESILEFKKQPRSADDLAQEAWVRLERLLAHYAVETNGYRSRALPFREGDVSGDYDHLARVLEWSAGGDSEGGEAE